MYCWSACEGRGAWSFTSFRVPRGTDATGGGRVGRRGRMGQRRRSGRRLMGGRCWSDILLSASVGRTAPIRRGQCPNEHVAVRFMCRPHPQRWRGGPAQAWDADHCTARVITHTIGGQLNPTAIRGSSLCAAPARSTRDSALALLSRSLSREASTFAAILQPRCYSSTLWCADSKRNWDGLDLAIRRPLASC